MKYFVIFGTYVLFSTFGLYKIKVANDYLSPNFFLGCFFYLSGFFIWFYILKITPLSVAFPVAAGLLIVATTFTGIVFLDEALDLPKILGAGLITIGIIVLSLGSRTNG